MSKIKLGLVFSLLAIALGSCTPTDEAATEQIRQTRDLTEEANAQVGMPAIVNFTERRMVRQLYELRDQEIATYTYVRDIEGRLWHVCNSIGYGIPYSAQFSNPEGPMGIKMRQGQMEATTYVLPLPEPNGLYPPTASSATFIICSSPTGEFRPIYEEDELTVSPFPLKAVGSYTMEEPPSWN